MNTINADITILIEWALHCRPDWDPDRLDRAVAAARTARWDDAKIAPVLVRMVFDQTAMPWQLADAAAQPVGLHNTVPASPEFMADALAQMRASLPGGGSR